MTDSNNTANNIVRETLGWLGIALVLSAFILTTLETIQPNDILYALLNGFGAIGIIVSSFAKRDWQPVVLNVVWLVVAVVGIIRSMA